jgi:hypothetical protein
LHNPVCWLSIEISEADFPMNFKRAVVLFNTNVKPSANVNASQAIESFKEMSQRFVRSAKSIDFTKDSTATHDHPWFGPLNARQWLLFTAPHQVIHREQMREIIKRL